MSLLRLTSVAGIAFLLGMIGQEVRAVESMPTRQENAVDYNEKIQNNVGRIRSFSTAKSPSKDAKRADSKDIAKHLPEFKVVKQGDSSEDSRKRAISELPFRNMTPANQQRTIGVIRNLSLFRQLPTLNYEIEPEAQQYFIRNPDAAVSIWRALGISKIQIAKSKDKSFHCVVGDGTITSIDFVHQTDQEHVVYCNGVFSSPFLLRPIKSECLLRLVTEFKKKPDGRTFVTQSADVFVALPSPTVEAAAKLVSPVSNMIADRNVREVSLFLHTMYKAMTVQPGWVEEISRKMEGVPFDRTQELMEVTVDTYVAAKKRRENFKASYLKSPGMVFQGASQSAPVRQTSQSNPAALK